MFINGMSIVDKHCQTTTIDQNLCTQMALLRIWADINERGTDIIAVDDDLQSIDRIILSTLREYIQALFTEYDDVYQQNKNHCTHDLIVKEKRLDQDKIPDPHSLILLDRFTPLTLGSIIRTNSKYISLFFKVF